MFYTVMLLVLAFRAQSKGYTGNVWQTGVRDGTLFHSSESLWEVLLKRQPHSLLFINLNLILHWRNNLSLCLSPCPSRKHTLLRCEKWTLSKCGDVLLLTLPSLDTSRVVLLYYVPFACLCVVVSL